jgi:hypothetical protein
MLRILIFIFLDYILYDKDATNDATNYCYSPLTINH